MGRAAVDGRAGCSQCQSASQGHAVAAFQSWGTFSQITDTLCEVVAISAGTFAFYHDGCVSLVVAKRFLGFVFLCDFLFFCSFIVLLF